MIPTRLILPTSLDPRTNKILLFDCLLLLGEELGSYYDSKMREKLGVDWLRELGQLRNQYNITLVDPDFVIKEPLRSDSPLRSILPKSPTFFKNLDILRRIRNYIAHNKTEGGYEQTREILGVLLAVALDIELAHCVNEYAGAIKRIEALDQGIKFEDNFSTQNRVEEFEDKSAELEELLFEEKAKSARIAQLLEEARSVVVIKEIELEALNESEQAKTEETKSMKSELIKAQQEAEELKVQLEENAQRTEDLKKSEANLKNLVASFAEAPAKMLTPYSSTDEARTEATKHENNDGSGESPVTNAPGTLWSRPKGNRKVVLSVSSRDLVETKNGKVLEGADPKQTKTFAESWLTIRPQGGRIFIDSDGHASTLIDDKLIYLGNVAGLFHKGI
jgi:hypothetical protein